MEKGNTQISMADRTVVLMDRFRRTLKPRSHASVTILQLLALTDLNHPWRRGGGGGVAWEKGFLTVSIYMY